MATVKKLGNFTGNDIELCRTTNQKASNPKADNRDLDVLE